jgi:hypothetical protein
MVRFKLKPVPRGSGMKAAQFAADILRETDNIGIGWGDATLLHMVCTRLGWPHEAWLTERRVLDAIDRSHEGVLVKRFFRERGLRRVFYLPERIDENGKIITAR